jgi:hypothetical protein
MLLLSEQRGHPLVEEMTEPLERLDQTALFKLPLTGGIDLTTLFQCLCSRAHRLLASQWAFELRDFKRLYCRLRPASQRYNACQ